MGRTDAKAEAPILWPPDVKNWLIVKDPDAGKDWKEEEKGTTEDEMVGWHHQLDRHEFEESPGVSDGQGSLACCSPGRQQKDSAITYSYSFFPKLPNYLVLPSFPGNRKFFFFFFFPISSFSKFVSLFLFCK